MQQQPADCKHVLVNCPFTIEVWVRIKKSLNLSSGWKGLFVYEFIENWNNLNLLYPTLPAFVSWYVWLEQNKAIFESGNPSIQKVVCQTLGVVGSSTKKEKVQHPIIKKSIPKEHKKNGCFDGAAQQSGVGGVLKINEHLAYKWTLNCGQGTNTKAKLMGVWATLTLASRLSITYIEVFGDSRIVIDWLNKEGAL
jgi:hypothetical protein